MILATHYPPFSKQELVISRKKQYDDKKMSKITGRSGLDFPLPGPAFIQPIYLYYIFCKAIIQ